MNPLAALAILSALLCLALLWSHRHQRPKLVILFKTSASLCFVSGGFLLFDRQRVFHYPLVLGLILGAGGDLLLAINTKTSVKRGIASFVCGHICYVMGFAWLACADGTISWVILAAISVVMVGLGAVLYRLLIPQLKGWQGAITAYLVVIMTMIGFALAAAVATPSGYRSAFLVIGSLLFGVSDLFVVRNRFIQEDLRNRLWGLPLYYTAQFLLVASMA